MAYTMGYGNNKALDKENILNYICYGGRCNVNMKRTC